MMVYKSQKGTFNQVALGSSPSRPTIFQWFRDLFVPFLKHFWDNLGQLNRSHLIQL